MTGLYFRVREGGALVFRPEEDPRSRRLTLRLIARVNVSRGVVRPVARAAMTAAESARIESWIAERRAQLAERAAARARLVIEEMNAVTEWLSGPARPEEVAALAEPLLLAMHDLRSALLRRQSGDAAPGATD
ncbi:MAG: hypothetical protein KatS3mg118_2797 [Paracoccaceae bacterium]|nr:MAG: hypothetical protein KatS3mg118_2797 [Paracoccaceae bacterium]